MTFARRVILENRFASFLIAGLFSADIALVSLVISPWSERVERSSQRADLGMSNRGLALRELRQAQATLDGQNMATAELQRFYSDVLEKDLATARSVSSETLAQLSSRYGLVMERRTTSIDSESSGSLKRLNIAVRLEGRYENMRRFLYALETGSDFIVIEEISLTDSRSADSLQVLTLGLATYFYESQQAEVL